MKKFGHWITNFFAITAAISVAGVQGAASEFANNLKEIECEWQKLVTIWAIVVVLTSPKIIFVNPQTDSDSKSVEQAAKFTQNIKQSWNANDLIEFTNFICINCENFPKINLYCHNWNSDVFNTFQGRFTLKQKKKEFLEIWLIGN